jgi:hypothetical protein
VGIDQMADHLGLADSKNHSLLGRRDNLKQMCMRYLYKVNLSGLFDLRVPGRLQIAASFGGFNGS